MTYALVAAVLVGAVEAAQPGDFQAQTWAWVAATAIMLFGFNLIFGVTGQMVFSHSFFWGVGAYISGVLTVVYHWNLIPALLVAVIGCALASYFFAGLLVGLRGFALAIASFVLPLTLPKLTNLSQQWTGGINGLTGIPLPVGSLQTYLAICLVVMVAGLWLTQNLISGRFGRAWRLVGHNEMMASSLGISPSREKVVVFIFSSSIAAVSGALFGPIFAFIAPDSFDLNAMLSILVGSVVGGAGTMIGGVIGALLVVEVPQLLVGYAENAALIYAIVLLVVLRVLPKGVAGTAVDFAYNLGLRKLSDVRHALGKLRDPRTVLRPGGMAADQRPDDAEAAASVLHALAPAVSFAPAGNGTHVVLRVEDVHVRFGNLQAVQGMSLTVEPGGFTGLIGPNGAGKSTLFNVISGFVAPNQGRVLVGDTDVAGLPVPSRAALGIARTFQETQVVGDFTARESVAVGAHIHARYTHLHALLDLPRSRRVEAETSAFADDLLRSVGVSGASWRRVRDFPYGDQKLVQVARALAMRPRFLLLDEPAAGLNVDEVTRLGVLLDRVRKEGVGILLVEHNVPFVLDHCDTVIVMHHGEMIAEGPSDRILASEAVREAYLGTSMSHREATQEVTA
ncbi:MAG TPA: branched-chain amino acid ABC transporter ATP-binding protein/permease [Candidatus Dormibacteraeota bacterium]|nr:branched-chain amino acid ABC transporter ATP-binding protein/permease [Candidatus Dormibacteraeota bacterium]